MSYRRHLVTRWSRRDRLAVLTIGLTTGLLVGTTLLLAATGAQVATVTQNFDTTGTATWYDDPSIAPRSEASTTIRLPITTAEVDGRAVTVVGLPDRRPGTRDSRSGNDGPPGAWADASLPAVPGPGEVHGPTSSTGRTRVAGPSTSLDLTLRPRTDESVLPPSWYVASERTVDRLGPTDAIVIAVGDSAVNDHGTSVPLVSVAAFFVAGTGQLLATLRIVTVGAGVLIAVIVFGVTRMTVRDRASTIEVLRVTGATPRSVLVTLTARAGLVTLVGVALGYAIGTIGTNAAVAIAVTAGMPTTLDPVVTGNVAGLLAIELGVLVIVGVVSGTVAAIPAVRAPPANVSSGIDSHQTDGGPDSRERERLSEGGEATVWTRLGRLEDRGQRTVQIWLRPDLLDGGTVVPAGATLSVFVTIAFLLVSLGGALAPIAAPGGSTIVATGAPNAVGSQVPASYASNLRSQGIAVSPEILLFERVRGQPVLARGVNFSAFSDISDATVVAGRPPRNDTEAVIGVDLARVLNVGPGDSLVLGGSTDTRIHRVTVVGIYDAPGIYDDQLLVSLPVARHLSHVGPNRVNYIRTDRSLTEAATRPADGESTSAIAVTTLDAPDRAVAGEDLTVSVTLHNVGRTRTSRSVTVTAHSDGAGRTRRTREVRLGAGHQRTVDVVFPVGNPGRYEIVAGDLRTTVRVVNGSTLQLGGIPERAPSNATLLVPVRRGNGRPVQNATVRIGDHRSRTDERGIARVSLPTPGHYDIAARTIDGATAEKPLRVENATPHRLVGRVIVRPEAVDPVVRPTATVRVTNPWARTLTRRIQVRGPRSTSTRRITIQPGDTERIRVRLARSGPGRHEVVATSDAGRLASTTYRVRGDERIVAALASSGRVDVQAQSSTFGQAVQLIFGNVELLLVTLLGLAAVTTVGSTAAGFASAVHARRETIGIYRATGATPRQVFGMVLADAVRIAVPATLLSLVVGFGGVTLLAELGWLTVYGVTVSPSIPPVAVLGTAVGAMAIALAGATLTAWRYTRIPPAALQRGGTRDQ